MATPKPSLPSLFLLLLLAATLSLCTAENALYSGETLPPGQSLSHGGFRFIMQTDCNLVLYDNRDPIWASGTQGAGSGCSLHMQKDGNLVIYTDDGKAVWHTDTAQAQADGNYVCILQHDRNVVIYSSPLWSTGTNLGTPGVTIAASRNATISAAAAAKTRHALDAKGRVIKMMVN